MSRNNNRHYKPSFLIDALANINSYTSCFATIIDLRPSNIPSRPTMMTLDDGTGRVPAVHFGGEGCVEQHLDIGDDVVVYGYTQIYRQDIQFKCDRIKLVTDPNLQTLWINQIVNNENREKNQ